MVPRLRRDEVVWIYDADGREERMACFYQKVVQLLRELICRFSKPGDTIVDLFGGSFSTGDASITIPDEEMRVFVGTEIDETVFTAAVHRVENTLPMTLADDSRRDIAFPALEFSEVVIEAATLITSHTRRPRMPRNIWGPPSGLLVLSILPKYITQHVLLRCQQMHRFSSVNGKPFHTWPIDLQDMMSSANLDELLAIECARTGLYVAPSKIKHEKAGLGVIASSSISKNEVVAPFYGRIVYDDLSDRAEMERIHGAGFTALTVEAFLVYNMPLKVSKTCDFIDRLPRKYGQSTEPYREIYVFPYGFNIAARINDPRYISGGRDRLSRNQTRMCNVAFVQKLPWQRVTKESHLTELDALKVVAIRNIKKGEELDVNYGSSHLLNLIASYDTSK